MSYHRRRAIALDELNDNFQANSPRKGIAMMFVIFGTMFPALEMAGFGEVFPKLHPVAWMAISGLCGAIGGAIFYPQMRFWFIGALCGALAGPTALVATYFYLLPRQEVWSAEFIIPLVLGVAPVFGLYYLLMRFAVVRAALAEDEYDPPEEY
jgi:hypothetical protein